MLRDVRAPYALIVRVFGLRRSASNTDLIPMLALRAPLKG